jgi:hypothetical protein
MLDEDPKFCLGLVRMQFEGELWSAIVLTRHALGAMGYFDEVCVASRACARECVCMYI